MSADDMSRFEGRTLAGRYVLQKCIGGGAFGAVFQARQLIMGVEARRVAVKLSRRDDLTERTVKTLFSDALVLAAAMDEMIDDQARRHLVHVYDGGLADGRAFLAMEFVPGDTLLARFRGFPGGLVPVPQLIEWARQIGRALRGIHGLTPPLVHRDLTPTNVLVGDDRLVRVVDFGLAATVAELGFAPGNNPATMYMAPEVGYGMSVPASDLYSTGLLMYEGLTGTHPFQHLTPPAELDDAHHVRWYYEQKQVLKPIPPSARHPRVPQWLDAVVLACLEFDPAKRITTADEFLAALEPRSERRPAETALKDAQQRTAEGDLGHARRTLERTLKDISAPADRLGLLRELTDVLAEAGDNAAAAERAAEAWELVDQGGLLLPRADRCALLETAESLYRAAGNAYLADQFAYLRRTGGCPA